ncbi:hypothetical protein D3C72_1987510 [compost metagenome]
MTLVSIMSCQSSSVISVNDLGVNVPALLTRMSTSGCAAQTEAAPSAVARSAWTVLTCAPGALPDRVCAARASLSALRPCSTTCAPASASPMAMASPMPPDDPVTSAFLLFSSIFMR